MTGYYASAVWVGHDNYKALASKATGSSAAAPLWQAYMSKIHANLPDKDILDGDASQYGVVKVTTCAVSGQLATDACYADTTYGTVTDYWAQGSVPTVYCQMHKTQNVCADSGEIASEYCPNVISKSVIVIPSGHPLYDLIGTEYDDVLEEYLGAWATVKFDSNGNVISGGQVCTYHTSSSSSSGTDYVTENTLIPDARTLLQQAYTQLNSMDSSASNYTSLSLAISNMESVLSSSSPSQSDVMAAMSQLTRAMAGLD